MSNFFQDTFVDTPGTALSSHTPNIGSYSSATTGLVITNSGQLFFTTPGASSKAQTGQQGATANVQVTFEFTVVTPYYEGVLGYFRDDGSGNSYEAIVSTEGTAGDAVISVLAYSTVFGSITGLSLLAGAHTIIVKCTTNVSNFVDFAITIDGTPVGTITDNGGTTGHAPILTNGNVAFGLNSVVYNTSYLTSVIFADATAGLASGTANSITATNTQVNLTSSAATGGSGTYTYCWHRDTDPYFTAGSGNALSTLGAHQNYADTTAVAGTQYFYIVEANDGGGSVYSNTVAGRLWAAQINLGAAGDSITNGQTGSGASGTFPGTQAALLYPQIAGERIVNCTNEGVNGSASGDWISGSTNLIAAKSAFASASVTIVFFTLGTNDCINSVSAATYKSNMQSGVNDLIGAGYKVILNYPTGQNPATSGATDLEYTLLQSYLPQLNSLVDNVNVFLGDVTFLRMCLENPDLWNPGGVHFSFASYVIMGACWAGGLQRMLNPGGGGGKGIVIPNRP